MKSIYQKVRVYLSVALLFISLLPYKALAALPRIPCPEGLRCPVPGSGDAYAISSVNELVYTVITWFTGIAFALAVLFLIIGGLRYIVSGGNEESAQAAKKTIINALIGIIVVIMSYVIVNVVANSLASPSFSP